MWCIAEITQEYRKRMYRLLDLYKKPYNPKLPVVCFDEKSKQLLEDSRTPIQMKPGSVKKYDYEYRRNGTCNIFVAVEPKAGKHHVQVTDQRKRNDFALFMKWLIDKKYNKAKKNPDGSWQFKYTFQKILLWNFLKTGMQQIA